MRWPWTRDRGTAEDAVQGAPDGAAPAAARVPELASAWRSAPAVQRSLDATLRTTTTSGDFASSLRAHQNPSFLRPLGHLVDPAGPSGLVSGLAAPAAAPK